MERTISCDMAGIVLTNDNKQRVTDEQLNEQTNERTNEWTNERTTIILIDAKINTQREIQREQRIKCEKPKTIGIYNKLYKDHILLFLVHTHSLSLCICSLNDSNLYGIQSKHTRAHCFCQVTNYSQDKHLKNNNKCVNSTVW